MLDAHSLSIPHVLRSSTAEADLRSTFRKCPRLMTTLASEIQPSSGQKRQRCAIEEEQSTTTVTSPQPPWKRVKRPFQSRQEANAAYWDSLSKLSLTRRALKEFDRRNRRTARPAGTAHESGSHLSRDPPALKDCSNQIKRFARHGGPDLRDLRGVSLAQVMSRLLLIIVPSVSGAGNNQIHCSRNAVESVHFQDPVQVHKYPG